MIYFSERVYDRMEQGKYRCSNFLSYILLTCVGCCALWQHGNGVMSQVLNRMKTERFSVFL